MNEAQTRAGQMDTGEGGIDNLLGRAYDALLRWAAQRRRELAERQAEEQGQNEQVSTSAAGAPTRGA